MPGAPLLASFARSGDSSSAILNSNLKPLPGVILNEAVFQAE
jgi:hypothetical protein